jgi:aspartyl-tRNA(Asn)/glutamyl-tRNA(Gln) amidotransferase subunit A
MSTDPARRLLDASIHETARALRGGEVTSEALTAAALERARQVQPALNAFIGITAEAALAQAAALDREAAAGRWRGLLHGIPLAHKDCFERAGRSPTVGSRAMAVPHGAQDATVLARLRSAGAIDLGPLGLNEAVAGPTGQNPHFGDCCNAWDPTRISGGSSSGSGAAVAAGATYGSLGSDTGGSIRLPASMNGLFGLKPTYGRVSRAGCVPRAFSLDCVGPLARSAHDCAAILRATAGRDPRDPSSADAPVPDYPALIDSAGERSRVAVLDTGVELDPEIGALFDGIVACAAARYGRIGRVAFIALDACYAMADVMSKVEAAALHGPWMRDHPDAYSQAVYSRTEPGLHVPAARYVEALNTRAAILREMLEGPLRDADVLLCPTTPVPVPTRIDADMEAPGRVFGVVARLTVLTRPFNYLGLPVLTMPMGLDPNGMPAGVQLVGRPFGEARLIAVAHALAADTGWRPRPLERVPAAARQDTAP